MPLTGRKASSGAYIPRIKKPAVSGGTKEGGSGLRVNRLKHKSVIVCEVPHICPLVEQISCAADGGDTDKNTGPGHPRPCNRVVKTAAAPRADRHGRDAVAFRKQQAITSPVEGPLLLLLVNLPAIVAARDAAETGAKVLGIERLQGGIDRHRVGRRAAAFENVGKQRAVERRQRRPEAPSKDAGEGVLGMARILRRAPDFVHVTHRIPPGPPPPTNR